MGLDQTRRPIKAAFLLFQEMALVSTLTISTVYLEDSGLYTCQSGFNSEANVTVIVISGKPQSIHFVWKWHT